MIHAAIKGPEHVYAYGYLSTRPQFFNLFIFFCRVWVVLLHSGLFSCCYVVDLKSL
jgi:hypothetical protein